VDQVETFVRVGEQDVLLGAEVAEESTGRHVGGGGDVGDRGLVVSLLGEK